MNNIGIDRVSVITPAYNSASTIAETLASLTNQTYSNIEILVVDDASDDDTVEIVRNWQAEDSRIKLFQLQVNSGAAEARNRAIAEATGRYIAFLDADDKWLPQKLERQLDFMDKGEHAFVHSWYQLVDRDGNPLDKVATAPVKMSYSDMLKSNRIGCLTAVYDVSRIGKIYMPLIRKRQDYGLWLSILKKIPYVYCVPESLALYRTGMDSVSSNKFEMLRYNWLLYREIEKFSALKSSYYLGWNILRRIIK